MTAIEYFASLTLGQRMGLAKNLSFRHGLVVIGFTICFWVAAILAIWGLMALVGLDISRSGRIRVSAQALGPMMTLLFAFLFMLGASIAAGFAGLGLNTLALRYLNRQAASIPDALVAPVSNRFGGILLSFLLWGLISTAIHILLFLVSLIPLAGAFFLLLGLLLYYLLIQVAFIYIADCINRQRFFKVTETISNPLKLYFGSFWLWLSALLIYGLMYLPALILSSQSSFNILSGSGLNSIDVFLVLEMIYSLLLAPFGLFLLAVTYKQAKARLLLAYQRQSSRGRYA